MKKNTKTDDGIEKKKGAMKRALATQPKEEGGSNGPEPVRYSKEAAGEGDWEVKGRCTDF